MTIDKKLDGALFDLDGILADSEIFEYEGWIYPLREQFNTKLTKEFYIKHYCGLNDDIIERGLIEHFSLNIPEGSLQRKKEKLLHGWLTTREVKIMPYAKEAVEFFVNKNIKRAVVSSASEKVIELKLRNLGLYDMFEQIFSADNVQRGKPYPDIYELSVDRINSKPEDCIAFEDTPVGVKSATSAGVSCLAIPNEWTKNKKFPEEIRKFQNLKEAVNWIEKTYKL